MIIRTSILLAVAIAALGFVISVHADPVMLSVAKLHQNDPAWSDVKLDNSQDTIGDFGCTLTVWTMLINFEIAKAGLKEHDKVISYTPAQINTLLNNYRFTDPKTNTTYDGWSVPLDKNGKPTGSNTNQNFGALRKAIEDDTKKRSDSKEGLVMKEYHKNSNKDVDSKKGTKVDKDFKPLKDAITHGDPVAVRVRGQDKDGNPVPNGHSVLVIGIDKDGNWVIADPFDDPNNEDTTLADPDYHNWIYGYDWGVFQKGGFSDPYSAPSPYDIDPADLYDPEINPDQYGFSSYRVNLGKISPVPEPDSIALLITGLAAIAWFARARRKEYRNN